MTGEPLAVMKSAGASVFAGTVVEEGSVVIKVRKLSSDTKISKIIELIDNSENLKAGVQSKAERLADSIVPYSFLAFHCCLLEMSQKQFPFLWWTIPALSSFQRL